MHSLQNILRKTTNRGVLTTLSKRLFCSPSNSNNKNSQPQFLINEIPDKDLNTPSGEILQQILSNLQQKGHTIFLPGDFIANSAIPVLQAFNVDQRDIVDILSQKPDIWLAIEGKKLSSLICALNSCQISMKDALELLYAVPELLTKKSETSLINQLSMLRSVFVTVQKSEKQQNLQEDIFVRFLLQNPTLLFEDPHRYREAKAHLANFFSSNQLAQVIHEYPEVLFVDREKIEILFDYLSFVMGLQAPQLVKYPWFQYSLEEIHLRYLFSTRSGNYIKPNEKKPTMSKMNVALFRFFSSSTDNLARQCGCSPEEFEVFRAIHFDQLNKEAVLHEIRQAARYNFIATKKYEADRMDDTKNERFDMRYEEEENDDDEKEAEDEDDDDEKQFIQRGKNNNKPSMVNKQWRFKREKTR